MAEYTAESPRVPMTESVNYFSSLPLPQPATGSSLPLPLPAVVPSLDKRRICQRCAALMSQLKRELKRNTILPATTPTRPVTVAVPAAPVAKRLLDDFLDDMPLSVRRTMAVRRKLNFS